MQGKNIINSIIAVVAIILGAAFFYITGFYPVILLLPVLALYFDAVYGRYFATAALLVCCSFLAFAANLAGMLLIFMAAITAAAGLVALKKGAPFFEGMGFTMASAVIALIGGVFAVFLANGRQDLMAVAAKGAADQIAALPRGYLEDTLVAYLMLIASPPENLNMASYAEVLNSISGIARSEQAQILLPQLRDLLAVRLPAAAMTGSMVYGGIVWYVSNLAIGRAVRKGRRAEGLKEFKAPDDFSGWRLPRWLVTTAAILLMTVFIIELSGSEMLFAAAVAVQSVVMAAVTVQGLALIRWYFKKWNLPAWGAWMLIAAVMLFLSFVVMWIGFIDILFNIRAFTENKKRIQSAMDQMRRKIEEEMQHQRDEDDGDDDDKHDGNDEDKQE